MTDFNNAWLGKGIIEQLKADFTIPDSNEPITWENVYKFLFGESTKDKNKFNKL